MKKIGLVFPGQGSQYVGMGKELYSQSPKIKETFDSANQILGFDLTKIVFEGPEETLRQTQYTQPAIFTLSVGLFSLLDSEKAIKDSDVISAGHSLGEYSALCSSGVFGFEDGLKLVKARGEFIQKASESKPGKMAAIIGLDRKKVEEICIKAKDAGVCEAVNFNSPGQIVIAGASGAIKKAVEIAQNEGAMKAIILNVSGAFHSTLMNTASEMMKQELAKYKFSSPRFPIVTNCDSEIISDSNKTAEKLVKQINNAVLWEDSVKKMIDQGVEIFIEIGPQRVLSGLIKRIDKTKKILNIEDQKSLEKTISEVK